MAALTGEKLTYKVPNTERYLPLKANTKIWKGAMVAVDATGFIVNVTAATGLTCIGVAMRTVDNTGGADGAKSIQVESGMFPMTNSTTASDDVRRQEIGSPVYGVDNQTVGRIATGRSVVGVLHSFQETDGLPIIRFE